MISIRRGWGGLNKWLGRLIGWARTPADSPAPAVTEPGGADLT
jgi:hypothetical protein